MATEEAGPPQLVLFSRRHCHLCEEMIAGLREMQARSAFAVEIVDVDTDDDLAARYGEDVPVLTHAGRELCRHRLDAPRVTAYLSSFL